MPRRNLYIVLGIPPDASPEVIRSAYRSLAKAYHPDRVGPGGTSQFREIAEAYRVLSDPESRGAHNRELHLPGVDERSMVEPLRPEPRTAVEPLVAEPIAIRRSFQTSHPSVEDDFLDWTTRHFTQSRVPKSSRQRIADVEVVLSADEAEIGGMLPIQVPAFSLCPACRGGGRDWFSFCRTCDGGGVIESRETLRLRIPRMVRDGTVWEVPVPQGGLHLRIRVRIDPFGW